MNIELPQAVRALLDALPAPQALLDGAAQVVAANGAWRGGAGACALLVPPACGASYLTWLDALRAESQADAEAIEIAVRRALDGRGAGPPIEHACTAGSARRVLTVRVAPLVGAEPTAPARILVAHEDISDLRGGERHARLSASIEETLRNSERRLLIADRLASLGALAASLAQEIHVPVESVACSLDVVALELGAPTAPDGRRERLDQAMAHAQGGVSRVRAIIRDLQSFSRSRLEESGLREVCDVRAVLDRSVRLAQDDILLRAQLTRSYAQVPPVEANPSWLGQVFLNLLLNAAQSIRPGDPTRNWIRLSVSRERAGRIVVEFAASGAEIPSGLRERIFDSSSATSADGAGLGLSICQGIVGDLGGELTVESHVGEGTRFCVALPASSRAITPVPPAPPPLAPVRRGRVLIVDDAVSIGLALRVLLGERHETVALTSGRAALELLRSGERFDAILCDLMMPEVSGMDFYVAMGELCPDQAQRIVFMTGGVFTAEARAFLDGVPNPVVEKPFDLAHVEALLRERVVATASATP